MNLPIIAEIESQMRRCLDDGQMQQLHAVLVECLKGKTVEDRTKADLDLIRTFLAAKRVEGCSDKTVHYYESTLRNLFCHVNKEAEQITTEDLRVYLDSYQQKSGAGKVTIDNIRRIMSSFFSWLEDEDYIVKSPVRRIHKVKTCKTVKETYSDEALEIMRDQCGNTRDLALIDLLASTGFLGKETNSGRCISMQEQRSTFRNIWLRELIIIRPCLFLCSGHTIVGKSAGSRTGSTTSARSSVYAESTRTSSGAPSQPWRSTKECPSSKFNSSWGIKILTLRFNTQWSTRQT